MHCGHHAETGKARACRQGARDAQGEDPDDLRQCTGNIPGRPMKLEIGAGRRDALRLTAQMISRARVRKPSIGRG